jgi:predicted SprT family Zn-dependent metalloprotease
MIYTKATLPIDLHNLIKSFIPDDIFKLRGVCKKSRFIELQDIEINPTLIKIKSIEIYNKLKHHKLKISLYLMGTKVTDVSMLGAVHTLDLSDTNVTDVSMM